MSNIYMIGNSLTDQVKYDGFKALAESRGKTHNWGRHVIPGTPLDYLVDHANSGFKEEPYGYYENAFSYHRWDAVTLQPFDRHLPEDLSAIDKLLKPLESKSPDAQVYVYAQWPLDNGKDWDTQWLRPYTGQWDDSQRSKAYYELLTRELNTAEPLFSPFYIIPVGHVMYELNQRMETGQVPGYSSITQLYSDNIHLNNVGSYLVATTFFATIYKENPNGLPIPVQYQPNASTDQPLSAFLAGIIQDAVWDIVTTTPLSGVSAVVPLTIRNNGLPEAIQAQTYSQSLEAMGGGGSYNWGIATGALPTGLTLSNTGTLSGNPTTTGTFNFTARVTDANGVSVNKPLTLEIAADTIPDITSTVLPNGARGSRYQQTLTATQGNGNVTWSLASGSLPTGITLRSDGLLAGTPGVQGAYNFSVRATDSDATPDSDTQALSLVVGAPAANTLLTSKTLSPIAIDGNLNESVWNLTNTATRTNIGTSNNTVKFGTLWDSTYLYVAAQITDSTIRKDSTNLWDDDAIEIFIDSKHDRESVFNSDDRQIIVDSNGNLFEQGGRSNGIQKAVQKNTAGYTVELAIPWANLGLTAAENLSIGFDFANDDDDNGGDRDSQQVWQNADVRNLSPNQFGNLLLSNTTVSSTTGTGTTGTGGTAPTTVTFENLTVGDSGSSTYNDASGYSFADVGSDKLRVYGTGNGYQTKVLHSDNWGRTIKVTKTNGSNFDLASFDYVASIWNDNADAIVTGYFTNGSTQVSNFATSSKQAQTLNLNWNSLSRVEINFAGGTNQAYGGIDNFVFGNSTSSTGTGTGAGTGTTGTGTTGTNRVTVTFENLNTGLYSSHAYNDLAGYTFADLQPYPDKLQIYGTSNGFQSKVLHPNNWGHSIQLSKTGGGVFDLASFDHAASIWNDKIDATVTGYVANGSTRSASFLTSTKQLQTLDLGWTGLDRVVIDFAGGLNAAYGALDNFVMAS